MTTFIQVSAKAPWEMEMTPWEAETTPWAIFRYDPEHQQHGEHCPPGADIVPPGSYTLLSSCVTVPLSFHDQFSY
jgi:hypothetical protein